MRNLIKVYIGNLQEMAPRFRAGYATEILESAHVVEPPFAYFKKDVYMQLNRKYIQDIPKPKNFYSSGWKPLSAGLPSEHTIMTPSGPIRKGCCR